jgi:hypothetical protein
MNMIHMNICIRSKIHFLILVMHITPLLSMEGLPDKDWITMSLAACGAVIVSASAPQGKYFNKLSVPGIGGKFFVPSHYKVSHETGAQLRKAYGLVQHAAYANTAITIGEELLDPKQKVEKHPLVKFGEQQLFILSDIGVSLAKKNILDSPAGPYLKNMDTAIHNAIDATPGPVSLVLHTGKWLGQEGTRAAFALRGRDFALNQKPASAKDRPEPDKNNVPLLTVSLAGAGELVAYVGDKTGQPLIATAGRIVQNTTRDNLLLALATRKNTLEDNALRVGGGFAAGAIVEVTKHTRPIQSLKHMIASGRFREHQALIFSCCNLFIRLLLTEGFHMLAKHFMKKHSSS